MENKININLEQYEKEIIYYISTVCSMSPLDTLINGKMEMYKMCCKYKKLLQKERKK